MAAAIGASTAFVTSLATPNTTAAITTTASGSSFFVTFVTGDTTTVTSVTDSKSNSYSLLASIVHTGAALKTWVYYTENGTGGSSHTFTATTSGNNLQIAGIEVTGTAASSIVDVSNNTYETGGTPFNCAVTTTVADTLILAFIMNDSASGTFTINGGFTLGETANSAASVRAGWGYKAVAAAGAEDPAWTQSGGASAAACITAAIKSGAGESPAPAMMGASVM